MTTDTEMIKTLVEDSIVGIEDDLIRHFEETTNKNFNNWRFHDKRIWLKNVASGKNNQQRLGFIALCNSIKTKKINELMKRCIKLDKENKKLKKSLTEEVEGETILLK